MFINKVNSVTTNPIFKGYQHVKNDVGETILKFNYPYDYEKEDCFVEIYRVERNDKYNYKVFDDKEPIYTVELEKDGKEVNLQEVTNLGKDEDFAYKIVRKDKFGNKIWEGADTGVRIKKKGDEYVFRVNQDAANIGVGETDVPDSHGNMVHVNGYGYDKYSDFKDDSIANYGYTLVKRNGTAPLVQGAGYLVMPDSYMPGMKYRGFDDPNTGETYFDEEYQKEMEGVDKTFSNTFGGSMAGLEELLPKMKARGHKMLFMTPIANGDNRSSHGYWNKNNMQVAENMGNTENYDSLMAKSFKNGIVPVFDATLTSEGLEGVRFNYALRWGDKSQAYNWFRMYSLKDANIGLGVVPSNAKNLSHRVVNSPFNYEKQSDGTYKAVKNDNYDSSKDTLFQIYDSSQVTEEQKKSLDSIIQKYDNIKEGGKLGINTHDDTVLSYVLAINPKEYQKRIDIINDLIKKEGKTIDLYASDGTLLAGQFSNFYIDKKTEGGMVTWDANTDMVKMNYGVSAYDEKLLMAIVDPTQRQYQRDLRVRGGYEVADMANQVAAYWTDKTKTAQSLYIAQTIGRAKTADLINDKIKEGLLPQEAYIKPDVLENIMNGNYNLAPKGVLSKDDATVKALMKLPLDSLELGEDTVGVLTTSYFSNRATTEDTIGKTRFELLKNDNPHLIKPYEKVYNRVNEMFTNELNDFAQSVIKKIDENSDTKLLDADGNYTEYGEYVIEWFGADIAKYALLKSLSGDAFRSKTLPNGALTYDYQSIKKATNLKSLGINASNPEEEAEMLQKKMLKGIKELSNDDISQVASSISKAITNTDTTTFRVSEAMSDYTGLGLAYRLDACKDIMDIDSIWNMDDSVDDVWNNLIKFWARWVQTVKSINPHSTIIAELTNVGDIARMSNGGEMSCPYNGWTDNPNNIFNGDPDLQTKFFNETGITSEAAYSYFFTELLTAFAREFESGTGKCDTHDAFYHKVMMLINMRGVDYIRNLMTFMGNHDKPRMLHCLSVDMELFHAPLNYNIEDRYENGWPKFENNRQYRLEAAKILTGVTSESDIPLEARLNIDNLNYFRTVSNKALAQTKLLSGSIADDLKGKIPEEQIKLLQDSLIDLANGNFLGNDVSSKFTKINISELSSIENAVNEVAKLAREKHGAFISQADIDEIIANAKNLDMNNYLVHGDFDWDGANQTVGDTNKGYLKEILGDDTNAKDYSLYTVQIARMIKDAAANGSSSCSYNINNALKDFVAKYNRQKINENSDDFKMIEDNTTTRIKDGYAAKDFRKALALAVAQAEFKSGKKIENKDLIISTVYKSITEPGMQKMSMITAYLSALIGMPIVYSGDEIGLTGYEEKTKNLYLQNRNVYSHSELNNPNSEIGKTMKKYEERITDSTSIKSNPENMAMREGTPYMMDVKVNGKTREEIQQRLGQIWAIYGSGKYKDNPEELKALQEEEAQLKLDKAKCAFMMQGGDGSINVSVFDAGGIEHDNRVNYHEKFGLHTKEDIDKFIQDNNIDTVNPYNPYVPMQEKTSFDAIILGAGIALPVGTAFVNQNGIDKLEYVVKQIGDKLGIVRRDGEKIVMDGITAKNGVLNLRKLKNVMFRGSANRRFYDNKYHFSTNIYEKDDVAEEGKKLSLIAR